MLPSGRVSPTEVAAPPGDVIQAVSRKEGQPDVTAPVPGDAPIPALRRHVMEAVRQVAGTSSVPSGDWEPLLQRAVTLSPPRDPAHGDLATNASLVLAKRVGMSSREFADRLARALPGTAGIESAERTLRTAARLCEKYGTRVTVDHGVGVIELGALV